MQENTLFLKKYITEEETPSLCMREVLRYSGYSGRPSEVPEEFMSVVNDCISECKGAFTYKVSYRRMDIAWEGDIPLIPLPYRSKDLGKCIKGCNEIIIFAATIGQEIDRLIMKYSRLSPVKAVVMQGYGAERVESLADKFCADIKEEVKNKGLTVTPRFSPGFGDLPLEAQNEIITLLDCNRKLGITLNESLLMSPSKSVTAIFGLKSN